MSRPVTNSVMPCSTCSRVFTCARRAGHRGQGGLESACSSVPRLRGWAEDAARSGAASGHPQKHTSGYGHASRMASVSPKPQSMGENRFLW